MSAALPAAPESERLSATPDQRRALRRVWPLVRTHRRAMVVAVAISATASVATLAGPILVTYRYGPDQPAVLSGIDLTITSGERVALVGATGSGKSTLAKVATGLLTPESGTVRIGGRPVDDWNRAELRHHVVLLPQEGHVVAGTLADNLRLVPGGHTDADLAAAIDRAGLAAWVEGLPDGLGTRLADRGADLSAGERQLVALARAALADPAVLVLDEATADVDPATEALVTGALERLTTGRTVIVVAHRPATAARCDRTVTLADGHIVGESSDPTRPAKEQP